jgi:predicted Zn-ribbon and HTH transcriptional regulator
MTEEEISFKRLQELFLAQRKEFLRAHCDFRKASSDEEIHNDQEEASKSLRRTLQGLTDAGILQQGVESRCEACGSSFWKEVSTLRQHSRCPGCGQSISLAVEGTWLFKLNALVRNAVAFHGCVPVISTLHDLRTLARTSFLCVPGLKFFESYGARSPVAEVDIVCVVDGHLWIGEIKQSSTEFTSEDLKKLARLAIELAADCAVLGCSSEEAKPMAEHQATLDQLLAGTGCISKCVVPDSWAFPLNL